MTVSRSGLIGARWRLLTPPGSVGAVAAIQVDGDVDAVCSRIGLRPVGSGQVVVRSIAGIDVGVVVRWNATTLWLMPHGGRGVVRAILSHLESAGVMSSSDERLEEIFPEASNEVEARMLAALARAASPLAIDLLLDQPRRWAAASRDGPDAAHSARLSRLIDPPLVVMLGPPNAGKSTLTNTLAGTAVSIVSEQPGTTRDHIGVMIDMAGLVVRFVDTPGLRAMPEAEEAEAAQIALELAARADLLLVCGDGEVPPPSLPSGGASLVQAIRVRMRSDLNTDMGQAVGSWPADIAVSGRTGAGVAELVGLIRDRLVPPSDRRDPRPWRFWPG